MEHVLKVEFSTKLVFVLKATLTLMKEAVKHPIETICDFLKECAHAQNEDL